MILKMTTRSSLPSPVCCAFSHHRLSNRLHAIATLIAVIAYLSFGSVASAASYADIDGDGILDEIIQPGEQGFSITLSYWDTFCYDYTWYPMNSYWDIFSFYFPEFGYYSDYDYLDIDPFWDYGYSSYAWCEVMGEFKIHIPAPQPGEKVGLWQITSGGSNVYVSNLYQEFHFYNFTNDVDWYTTLLDLTQIWRWIMAKQGTPKLSVDHDLWWLNGETQPGWYFPSATITASPVTTGTFQWDVVQGSGKVNLNNGGADSDSILAIDDNTITIKSTAPSDPASGVTNDVQIRLTYNNGNGDLVSYIWLSVFAPDHMVPLSGMNTHEAFGDGYISRIWYRLEDQFNQTLPAPIDLNEDIDGNGVYSDGTTLKAAAIDDWNGQNWPWPEEAGGQITPSGVFDTILRPTGNYPSIQHPQSPLGTVEVVHSPPVAIYIGTATIGDGVKVVNSQIWQMYRDHGDHN